MRHYCSTALLLLAALSFAVSSLAAEPKRLSPEDVYRLDGPQSVVVSPTTDAAAVIRRWVDEATKQERLALWWRDSAGYRALEQGEPDARSVTFSPDGKWLAVRSTRARPDGWKQTLSVPLQSDAATDIWLMSSDGSRDIPLAGPDKPYGRVFNDPFLRPGRILARRQAAGIHRR
jgi:dipeptidyl aminopeptidase/acylaminoacyl peptidase